MSQLQSTISSRETNFDSSKMQEMKKFFGRNLRIELIKRRMSQTELATLVGVKPQTVSSWCNEREFPVFGTYCRICEVFDKSVSFFLKEAE